VHRKNTDCYATAIVNGLHSHTQEDGVCHLSVDASNLTLTNLQGFGRQTELSVLQLHANLLAKPFCKPLCCTPWAISLVTCSEYLVSGIKLQKVIEDQAPPMFEGIKVVAHRSLHSK